MGPCCSSLPEPRAAVAVAFALSLSSSLPRRTVAHDSPASLSLLLDLFHQLAVAADDAGEELFGFLQVLGSVLCCGLRPLPGRR